MKSNLNIIVGSKAKDFLNTAKMIPARLSDIKSSSDAPATDPDTFTANRVSAALHPGLLSLKITKITEHTPDIKSYYFTWTGSQPLAYFNAGQYITLVLKIGDSLVTRAYSLCTSPGEAKRGIYGITVKRVENGFVSNYILDNFKPGDRVDAYAPEGRFFYEPLRDAGTVIAAAGGSGITPFISMAKALDEKTEDFNLVLLYGAKNKKELVFKKELDEIAERNGNFKVVYVLSDNRAKDCERGFITAELIKKYTPENEEFSVFACGPAAMYKFLDGEIEKLGIRKKFYRKEMFGAKNCGEGLDGVTPGLFTLTVKDGDGEKFTVPCRGEETVLVALERAGIAVPARCRSGECGFCRSRLVAGSVFIPHENDFRRLSDLRYGYIHPCCCYPLGDIEIKIN